MVQFVHEVHPVFVVIISTFAHMFLLRPRLGRPPLLLTEEDHRIHRRRAVLGLASEQDQRAVQDWYASHPREASEEAEHWTRLVAERAALKLESTTTEIRKG